MSAPDDPTTAAAPPTPEQLAEIQAFLNSQRIPFYLPFLVGSFLDALFLGLLLVVFAHWLPNVRPTDRKWVQALVWYEMAVSITVSAIVMNHTFLILVPSFGDFQAILTPHGTSTIRHD